MQDTSLSLQLLAQIRMSLVNISTDVLVLFVLEPSCPVFTLHGVMTSHVSCPRKMDVRWRSPRERQIADKIPIVLDGKPRSDNTCLCHGKLSRSRTRDPYDLNDLASGTVALGTVHPEVGNV